VESQGNGWGDEALPVDSRGVFMNEMLHLISYDFKILTVDTKGKTWMTDHSFAGKYVF